MPRYNKGRGEGLTASQKAVLKAKEKEKRLNEENIDNLKSMESLGLRLNDVQKERLKDAKDEQLFKEETASLEKKLLKMMNSVNVMKGKQATLAKGQLDALKKARKEETLSEDSFKTQVMIVEQLAGSLASVEDVLHAIANLPKDATESMKEYLNTQLASAAGAEATKGFLDSADDITGGLVTKAKDFIKALVNNPMAAMVTVAMAALKDFSEQVDKIGESFGAMGVLKFRDDIIQSDIAMRKMGFETGTSAELAEKLSNEFGIGFKEAIKLAPAVADMSKSLGVSVAEGAAFFGTMTEIAGLTDQQALDMGRMVEQLAVANGVAPGAVMKDIAASSETFAKFSDVSGENIFRTAIQAKKLGISLDDVAGIAENMVDFSSSIEAEMKASVMTGKQLNFQRARELALMGDTENMMKAVLDQVGSESEFLSMNLHQRKAIAAAAGTDLSVMMKLVAKEEESATLMERIQKGEGFEKLVSEETMSAVTELVSSLASMGAVLSQTLGPPLNFIVSMFTGLVEWVDKFIGLGPALIAILIAVKGAAMKAAAATMLESVAGFFRGASLMSTLTMGFGTPLAVAAAVAAAGVMWSWYRRAQSAGDMISPAKGKTMVSTKEGGLFEMSDNDDLIAGPGVADSVGGGSVNMGPVVSAIGGLKEKLIILEEENKNLRKDMKGYFGVGGTAVKGIGRQTATSIGEL